MMTYADTPQAGMMYAIFRFGDSDTNATWVCHTDAANLTDEMDDLAEQERIRGDNGMLFAVPIVAIRQPF